jgi:tetratricopeptide (TPR) repeat protein
MVIATDPSAKNAYLILADCYLQTGQSREAVAVLEPRASMFGDDLAFAYVLGTALLQTGDETRGQQFVDRIFRAGDSAEGQLLLATAYLNRFDYPAAKKELERALQLNPRLPTANSAYGRALLGLGDQPEAEKAFRRELDVNINDFEANLMLGSMRKSAQDFENATTYLSRAAAIHPGDLTARKLLASIKLQTGAVEEAVRLLEQVIAEAPDTIDAHVQLATAYYRLKRKEDGDRQREIVNRLNAEIQAKQPAPESQQPAPVPGTPAAPQGTSEDPRQ